MTVSWSVVSHGSLSPWERAGGEGRCALRDCVGGGPQSRSPRLRRRRGDSLTSPLPCAHTVAPKGPRGPWDKAPHPNPLPEGEGTRNPAEATASDPLWYQPLRGSA